ncbi:MAG: hypothetical protein IT445_15840 [Phycisphaeraceae bacterium]|nr:hypothetical protein [Phycisphaeraceae bacterium]
MDGFVLWAKQNANAAMLQNLRPALVQAAAAQPAQSNEPCVNLPRSSWPAPIAALQPSYVFVYPDDSIDLVWGGGFGHWGLYLHGNGPPQSVMLSNSLVWPVEPGLDAWSGH